MTAFEKMNKDLTQGISTEEMNTFYAVMQKMKDNITQFSRPGTSKKLNDPDGEF